MTRSDQSAPGSIHFEKIMLGMIFGRWQSQMVFDNRYVEVIQSVDHAIFPAC